MPKQVQVGNRFTHGKSGLVQVELAFEQHRQHLGGTAGPLRAGQQHFSQTLCMVLVQLRDALVQAGEGFAVRRQCECLRIERAKAVNRVKKLPQRIAFRLLVVDAHIG